MRKNGIRYRLIRLFHRPPLITPPIKIRHTLNEIVLGSQPRQLELPVLSRDVAGRKTISRYLGTTDWIWVGHDTIHVNVLSPRMFGRNYANSDRTS